jgi:hypothetical protein
MSHVTDSQIIEKIRETAERVFDGIGISKLLRSEVEQDARKLRPGQRIIRPTHSMVEETDCAWCEYRVDIGYEQWLNVRVTVRGMASGEMTAEVDNLAIWQFNDFANFCSELAKRLIQRAKGEAMMR